MDDKTINAILNDSLIKQAFLNEFFFEAYHKIQGLGGPGVHSENSINRQEALDTLKKVHDELLDKEIHIW